MSTAPSKRVGAHEFERETTSTWVCKHCAMEVDDEHFGHIASLDCTFRRENSEDFEQEAISYEQLRELSESDVGEGWQLF